MLTSVVLVQDGASFRTDVLPVLWRLLLVQVAVWLGNVGTGILFAMARWEMTMENRKRFFTSLLKQDLAFFDSERVATLAAQLASEPDRMHNIVNHSIEKLLKAVVSMCTCDSVAIVQL